MRKSALRFDFLAELVIRHTQVDELKTIAGVPRSHAFVERLIGTIRREYLDRIWFWGWSDLERKLEMY